MKKKKLGNVAGGLVYLVLSFVVAIALSIVLALVFTPLINGTVSIIEKYDVLVNIILSVIIAWISVKIYTKKWSADNYRNVVLIASSLSFVIHTIMSYGIHSSVPSEVFGLNTIFIEIIQVVVFYVVSLAVFKKTSNNLTV